MTEEIIEELIGVGADCPVCGGALSLVSHDMIKVSPNTTEWIEECEECGLKVKVIEIIRYEKRIEKRKFYHATCKSCGFTKDYQSHIMLCPRCNEKENYLVYDSDKNGWMKSFEKETVTKHRIIESKREIVKPSKFGGNLK
jgi:uncharacterized protein YbaR (Trm112 family)